MPTSTAFLGTRRIASGDLKHVAAKAKEAWDTDKWAQVLVFDDATSELIEIDFRGSVADVVSRIATPPEVEARKPGRPRLGVVAREVTLLPRHWEWLSSQPGGASVALRKLVEQARIANQGADQKRRAQEAAYRFMSAAAGNEPGFEEAIRGLFGGNREQFQESMKQWPKDLRDHAKKLAAAVFVG